MRWVDEGYVEPCQASGDWVVAWGGRCYKADEEWQKMLVSRTCPICNKYLGSQEAYEAHFVAKHEDLLR